MGTIIASIFANSWIAQSDVLTTTQATNRGQLMGQSIEKSARNADAIRITSDGRYVGFRVRTSSGYSCAAYLIQSASPADSLVSTTASPLLLPTATGWPQPWLSKNVQPKAGNPYFAVSSTSTPVVTYLFQIRTNAAPVTISGQASARGQGILVSTDSSPQGASPCWS